MGYIGKASDGATIKLFTKAECDTLGGIYHGNGECTKREGGSYSWDCRNEPMSSQAKATESSSLVSATAEKMAVIMPSSYNMSWVWIAGGALGVYALYRFTASRR